MWKTLICSLKFFPNIERFEHDISQNSLTIKISKAESPQACIRTYRVSKCWWNFTQGKFCNKFAFQFNLNFICLKLKPGIIKLNILKNRNFKKYSNISNLQIWVIFHSIKIASFLIVKLKTSYSIHSFCREIDPDKTN